MLRGFQVFRWFEGALDWIISSPISGLSPYRAKSSGETQTEEAFGNCGRNNVHPGILFHVGLLGFEGTKKIRKLIFWIGGTPTDCFYNRLIL